MMCADDRCVLCNSGETEDVKHFLVKCEEFRSGGGGGGGIVKYWGGG